MSVVVKITLIFVRSNKTGGGGNKHQQKADEGTRWDEFPPTFCLWRRCATCSGELMSTESWSGGLDFRYQSNLKKINLDRVFTLCQQISSVFLERARQQQRIKFRFCNLILVVWWKRYHNKRSLILPSSAFPLEELANPCKKYFQ